MTNKLEERLEEMRKVIKYDSSGTGLYAGKLFEVVRQVVRMNKNYCICADNEYCYLCAYNDKIESILLEEEG